jgi:hypothetical protein
MLFRKNGISFRDARMSLPASAFRGAQDDHMQSAYDRVMTTRLFSLIGALITCISVASAQTPSNPLDRFAGDWDLHGEAAGQSYHILEYCRWSNQHTFMICEERAAGKPAVDLTLMWHDGRRSVYRFAGIGMRGPGGSGTISIGNDRWIWSDVEGQVHYRTINLWVTPDEIRYTSESSRDGGKTWKSDGQGTERRIRRI